MTRNPKVSRQAWIGGVLALAAAPAAAWEFTPLPVCTLRHDAAGLQVSVTYDPALPEPYAIALARPAPWPDAPVFSLRFDGPFGLTISTDRHVLSDGGRTLTVTDRGFGNVLDGLEFNATAAALAGDATVPMALDGAAEAVRAFRSCPAPTLS